MRNNQFLRWTAFQMSHLRRCLHTKRQLTASLQNPFWWEALSMSNLLVSLSSSWCVEWSYAHSFRYLPYVNTYTKHHAFFAATPIFVSFHCNEVSEKNLGQNYDIHRERNSEHTIECVWIFYLGWSDAVCKQWNGKKLCCGVKCVCVFHLFNNISFLHIHAKM